MQPALGAFLGPNPTHAAVATLGYSNTARVGTRSILLLLGVTSGTSAQEDVRDEST